MKKLLKHKIGSQEFFSTPGLVIQLGQLPISVGEEVFVPEEQVDEVFKSPKKFSVKDQKLYHKESGKEVELTDIIK